MLYIDRWLCNNGSAREALLSVDKVEFTTREHALKKFVIALGLTSALLASGWVHANPAAGQTAYAARGCIGCHGAGGVSVVSNYPSLKGKDAAFIRQSLTDFRSGARKDPVMNAMAAALSDADIANIADYIDSLK